MHGILIAACALPGFAAVTTAAWAVTCLIRAEPEFPPPPER